MEKHFCDECGKELTPEELRVSSEVIGYKELCRECTNYYDSQQIKWSKTLTKGFVKKK